MFEAKTRDYFHGVCDHFLIPATEVKEIVQLVLGMEILTIYSLPEARNEHKDCFGSSSRLTKGFLGSDKISRKKCDENPPLGKGLTTHPAPGKALVIFSGGLKFTKLLSSWPDPG